MRLKGWGSPNSNEGTYTVVLYIYKYFVRCTVVVSSQIAAKHAEERRGGMLLKMISFWGVIYVRYLVAIDTE